MKTCQMFIFILAIFFTCISGSPAHAKSPEHRGYITKLRSGLSSLQILHTFQAAGIPVETSIPALNMVVTKNNPAAVVHNAHDLFEYVEPNYVIRLNDIAANPPIKYNTSLWGMTATHADEAWLTTTGSKDVVVAVSDTGIWNHFNLEGNIWMNPGESGVDTNGKDKSKNKVDDDGNGYIDDYMGWNFESNTKNVLDDHYHGTHVAGTIGANRDKKGRVNGVAWNVSLMALKFIGRDGTGTDSNAIKTIIYAADNGAKVINCSWGGDGFSQALYDAVEYAKSKGMLVVAAAGNDHMNTDLHPQYPSAQGNENLISVGASEDTKNHMSYYTNWGLKTVDLAAPGSYIFSTFNPSYSQLHQDWYEYLDGTSMATPHVTGAIALLYSVNPNLNWRQVKDILLSTVTPSNFWAGKSASGGVLNIGAAVKAAALTK